MKNKPWYFDSTKIWYNVSSHRSIIANAKKGENMAKLDLQVREKQFTDPKTQRTITFDILVLVVPTILGSTEVELTARNEYQRTYLKDYLKLLKKGE
jgi:hypothetical protein